MSQRVAAINQSKRMGILGFNSDGFLSGLAAWNKGWRRFRAVMNLVWGSMYIPPTARNLLSYPLQSQLSVFIVANN